MAGEPQLLAFLRVHSRFLPTDQVGRIASLFRSVRFSLGEPMKRYPQLVWLLLFGGITGCVHMDADYWEPRDSYWARERASAVSPYVGSACDNWAGYNGSGDCNWFGRDNCAKRK